MSGVYFTSGSHWSAEWHRARKMDRYMANRREREEREREAGVGVRVTTMTCKEVVRRLNKAINPLTDSLYCSRQEDPERGQ
jgi:hypothetical protein